MQEYKDWDGNLLPDPTPRIHNVHIGDTIKIKIKHSNQEPRADYFLQEVTGSLY